MLIAGVVLLILVLLLLRQPVFIILIAVVIYAYYFWDAGGLRFIILDAWDALNREVLLSIPLYLLAGNLISHGTMADRLIELLRQMTCFVPGGLALAAVLTCALFGAISGSSTVTLVAVGGVMYPALIGAGYSKSLAIGTLCAAGTLGIIIPPSIPLILYGVMTGSSIIDLFRAGIGPALVLTAILATYVVVACRQQHTQPFNSNACLAAMKSAIWPLFMPVIVLGGIYSGYVTATEAAVLAVFYTLFVQGVVYREMDFQGLYEVVTKTTGLIGSLFPVLMLAVCLNLLLTYQQLPEQLVHWVGQFVGGKWEFLAGTNVFLLLLGSVMDVGSVILIFAPLLEPMATNVGMDPIHFGVLMIVNLEIGYLTPPMGLNLIVAMGVFKEDFWTICRAALPFILLILCGLIIVALIPAISLFLV